MTQLILGDQQMPVFGIGKFWTFVFSGLFTFVAQCCVLVLGYFSVVGENLATINSSEAIQMMVANRLLWRMGVIQNFLWGIFVILLLFTFWDYIKLLWVVLQERKLIAKPKVEIPSWFYTGLRYSIFILLTVFSLLAAYNVALIIPSSVDGSAALTSQVAQHLGQEESLAAAWCNLAYIYDVVAYGFLMYWICSVWLLAFGYLLKYELDCLWSIVMRIPRWIYRFINADDLRV